jgi:predicted Zn finger-like uncharacterized protein
MILTCPECATRYFVGDDQVGATGRTVKCKACGHRWTARAEPDLDLSISGEEGAIGVEPSTLTPEPAPLVELPGEELPKVFRAKAQSERRVREAATTGIVWAGMTAMLIVLGVGAVIGREGGSSRPCTTAMRRCRCRALSATSAAIRSPRRPCRSA